MQEVEKVPNNYTVEKNVSQTAALTMPDGRPVNPWLALLSLMFGFFMSLLDATIVNIAISDIQTKLKTDLTTVSWVLNAYSLVFAVLLVTMGRFADQFGRKKLFMIGMVLFSFGSLLCAIAPTIEWLIAFRAIQAIGAAALNPVSLALITVIFPPQKRGAAFGIWGALAGLAAALGPILGGFLVQTFDWRWIFYVNLPFCIIGLFMVARFVPESRDLNATKAIDVLGFLTLTAGLFCVVLAIIEGNDWGWTSFPIIALFVGSLVSLGLFFVVENAQKQPIFDFSLFKFRSFSAVNATMFMFGVAIQGAFLILVLYLINAQGYDQLGAAYAMIPIPGAAFVVSALAGRFSNKFNPRLLSIIGLTLIGIGMAVLATLGTDATYFDIAWRGVIVGLGMGMCFTSLPSMVLTEIPKNKVGVGSGAFNTFRQVGFTLGVAILLSLFIGQGKDTTAQARERAVAIVQAESQLPEQVRANIVTGLRNSAAQTQASGERASFNTTQFDLTKLADQIPNGQALKPQLSNLNTRIGSEFKRGVVDAFAITWIVAAIIAFVGVIPALLIVSPKRANLPEGSEVVAHA